MRNKTRAECITAAAQIFVEACRVSDSLPAEEAARRAYTPTGPSIEELERRIRAQRGLVEDRGHQMGTPGPNHR